MREGRHEAQFLTYPIAVSQADICMCKCTQPSLTDGISTSRASNTKACMGYEQMIARAVDFGSFGTHTSLGFQTPTTIYICH
eukprot:6199714-Pleurochrysis_carterae.AAC.7